MLTAILIIPITFAVMMRLFQKREIFLISSVLGALFAVALCFKWSANGGELYEVRDWITKFGIEYRLNLTGINLIIISSTLFLLPFLSYLDNEKIGHRGSFFWILIASLFGMLLATDLILLNFFMISFTFVVIATWKNKIDSYLYFALLISDALLLAAIVYGGAKVGSFSIIDWQKFQFVQSDSFIIFWCVFISFAARICIFPMQRALSKSANALSSLELWLFLLTVTMGLFLCYRFSPILREAYIYYSLPLMIWCVLTITYNILLAKGANSRPVMIALFISSQAAFSLLGFFSFQDEAMLGSTLLISAIPFNTALLIFAFADRSQSHWSKAVTSFAVIGIPPLAGFLWNFYTLMGVFQSRSTIGIIAAATVVIWLILFMSKLNQEFEERKFLYIKPIIAAMILIYLAAGIYPKIWIKIVDREAGSIRASFVRSEKI